MTWHDHPWQINGAPHDAIFLSDKVLWIWNLRLVIWILENEKTGSIWTTIQNVFHFEIVYLIRIRFTRFKCLFAFKFGPSDQFVLIQIIKLAFLLWIEALLS